MEERVSDNKVASKIHSATVTDTQDKSATRCASAKKSLAQNTRANSSRPPVGSCSISKLKATVGRGHATVRNGLASSVNAAKETGEQLQNLKKLVPHGTWGRTLDELARDYGLTKRTAQFYIQMAENWKEISQTHPELTDYSLRLVQKLLAKPKPDKDKSASTVQETDADATTAIETATEADAQTNADADRGNGDSVGEPPDENVSHANGAGLSVVRQAISVYFSGQIDIELTADSELGIPGTLGSQGGSSMPPVEWSGNVACILPDTEMVNELVVAIVTEFATEAIEEALLFIPARLNAPWIRLLDRYPRVFLESTSPAGEQPLMLVGLIHSERAIEFHAAFKTVGSVFYPISFISEDLES